MNSHIYIEDSIPFFILKRPHNKERSEPCPLRKINNELGLNPCSLEVGLKMLKKLKGGSYQHYSDDIAEIYQSLLSGQ